MKTTAGHYEMVGCCEGAWRSTELSAAYDTSNKKKDKQMLSFGLLYLCKPLLVLLNGINQWL